jgi:molybdate-binding protein
MALRNILAIDKMQSLRTLQCRCLNRSTSRGDFVIISYFLSAQQQCQKQIRGPHDESFSDETKINNRQETENLRLKKTF